MSEKQSALKESVHFCHSISVCIWGSFPEAELKAVSFWNWPKQELREKNWSAMEALSATESMLQGKLSKTVKVRHPTSVCLTLVPIWCIPQNAVFHNWPNQMFVPPLSITKLHTHLLKSPLLYIVWPQGFNWLCQAVEIHYFLWHSQSCPIAGDSKWVCSGLQMISLGVNSLRFMVIISQPLCVMLLIFSMFAPSFCLPRHPAICPPNALVNKKKNLYSSNFM